MVRVLGRESIRRSPISAAKPPGRSVIRPSHALPKLCNAMTLWATIAGYDLPVENMTMLEPIEGLGVPRRHPPLSVSERLVTAQRHGCSVLRHEPSGQARIDATRDGPDGWAERGTTIHNALEQHLLGAAEVNPGRYEKWIQPLLKNWLVADTTPMAVEYRMCDPKISLGGSFDFLIEHKGKKILGDLKTVSTASAVQTRKPANAQLGGYLHMLSIHHPRLWIDRCVTLVCGPGVSKVLSSDPMECTEAWDDAWGRYSVYLEVKEPF